MTGNQMRKPWTDFAERLDKGETLTMVEGGVSLFSAPFARWRVLWLQRGQRYQVIKNLSATHSPSYVWPRQAVEELSRNARLWLEQRRQELESLLRNSQERLAPLGEPLLLDLGAHRWLKSEREEAYSDWLAWLLRQMPTGEILKLLELPSPEDASDLEKPPLKVHREMWVEKGHEEATGRLDVVVMLPNKMAIVIEVKKGCLAASDLLKQGGYYESVRRSGWDCRFFLLVTDEEGESSFGFTVLPYSKLCRKLRLWAQRQCHHQEFNSLGRVGMILAFVAAVESNLLGISLSQRGLPSEAALNYFLLLEKESLT
jgi:hypothetical protein